MSVKHFTSKTIHMSQSIEGALKNYTPRQFEKQFANCITGPDGKLIHPREARKLFQQKFDAGERLIPMGDCDGFDPVTGCPGHPCTDELQPEKDGQS